MRRLLPTAATLTATALTAAALTLAAPAGATLATGAKAPDFTTRGAIAGKVFTVHLAQQLKKGPVVLYFFPAAYTGGCNAEAHAFAEAIPAFTKAGATVIGMSADTVDTLAKFSAEKCAGKFAVASAGPAVVSGYDVALPQQVKGRSVTSRTSYVIAKNGTVGFVHSDMNPADHVSLTLAAVQKMAAK
ncbi:redoxin domain-containing protein [Sphingomonas ginsenosidivorax]|uniref:thioredoxin-dependent peroxiredoxin n=1 Tax=Sphingomonas ginsenosidivorax TaxID=862135 RepID=A0A5C6UIB7_9SPHN|nr:redoxin domain-containing protein [Sphingomonas ginsenosidivorax]TXC72543.1 redoxin domain-containing protein [Sphingomonas ginsenosidivorax]